MINPWMVRTMSVLLVLVKRCHSWSHGMVGRRGGMDGYHYRSSLLQLRTGTIPAFSSSSSSSSVFYSTVSAIPCTITSDTTSNTTPITSTAPAKFVKIPFDYHQEIDIQIEKLTNRGWGVGRVSLTLDQRRSLAGHDDEDNNNNNNNNKNDLSDQNDETDQVGQSKSIENTNEQENDSIGVQSMDNSEDNQKWVVMVPNVIPGEMVRVRVFRNFPKYSEADLVEVLEASKDRVNPVCDLAMECGGCQLQHMSIQAQRDWKSASVSESLAQYGFTGTNDSVTVSPCIGTDHVTGYRSKITPHFNAPEKRRRGGTGAGGDEADTTKTNNDRMIQMIGFQRQTSRQLMDVAHCPIATDEVNATYRKVREKLLSEPWRPKRGSTLLFRQDNLGPNSIVSVKHRDYLTTRVRGLQFTYQAGNFFQNNYHVLPLMVDHVVHHSAAPILHAENKIQRMTHLVDCYCGSGLFAVSCASKFQTVMGIEINDEAVKEATKNAWSNDARNCRFRAASAEAIFSDIQNFPRDTTTVIIDPPRKGCSDVFLQQLYDFRPRRVVYMSCDPTTQARDAQGIVEKGGYRILSVQPFDLFPQTRHIECLMIFERDTICT